MFDLSLSALRTFEAVARLRSMSQASRELHITQGAVSRAIQVLEKELGAVLFRRTKPLLSMTEAGNLLYAEVRQGFQRFEHGIRSVQLLQQPGRLIIDSLPTFAIRFLIPRLPRLRQVHPDMGFDLTVSEKVVDFENENIDIAIRYGLEEQWSELGRVRIMEEELVLACAPHTLRSFDKEFQLFMLEPRMLLRHTTREEVWREWFMVAGVPYVEPQGLGLEHFIMVIEAAVAGMGFALLPRFMIQRELAAKTLVIAAAPFLRRAQGYHVLFAAESRFDQRILTFVRWLSAEVRQNDLDMGQSS